MKWAAMVMAVCVWFAVPASSHAQSPPPPVNFEVVQDFVSHHTPADLKTGMFPEGQRSTYVRAEALRFLPSRWGVVMLSTRPEPLFANDFKHLAGLCRIETAQAVLRTASPPSYLNARTEVRFKAVPRAGLGGLSLQDYCDSLPAVSFDFASASDTELYAMEALYRLLADPEAADIADHGCITPNRGVLCGLSTEDLKQPMTTQAAPCISFFPASRRTPEISARFKNGWCFQIRGGGRLGFTVLIEAGAERPNVQFSQALVLN